MKKQWLITLAVFLCVQLSAQKGIHIGGKFLPQSTWMFNNDDSDNGGWEYVPTYRSAYGANLAYYFNDGFGIGTELMFSKQGQRFKVDTGLIAFTKLEYMKIPLLFHFNTSVEHVSQFYFNIGPQVSMLRTAELEKKIFNEVTTIVNSEAYQKMYFGGVMSLGACFRLAPFLNFNAGIRFDATWMDTENKDSKLWPANRAKTWQTIGAIDLGLRFVIGTGKKES